MIADGLRAEYIGETGNRLFALLRAPDIASGECTLVVPPLAEEMNKCRRIVTEFAQRERGEGRAVLCVDLSGTGDSDGELAGASVGRWLADIATAISWSASVGWRVSSLLGIRFGALLAAAYIRQRQIELSRVIFWQPATKGARLIDQLLRLRVVASRMESARGESAADLRARLKAGETIEVAGYTLSGSLCADIDSLDLHGELSAAFPPIRWLDVIADAEAGISPATQRALDSARAIGCRVEHIQVPGEPFWMSTEIVSNAALVAAS